MSNLEKACAHLFKARMEAYDLGQRAATQAAIGLEPDMRVSIGQGEMMSIYYEIDMALKLLEGS